MESREDKSLFQNHVSTFEISSFTTFISLLIILCFFLKMNDFLNKIGPIWAIFYQNSLNNGYVEGSFITFLEPVGAAADPKSVVRNLVAPRIL